MDMKNASKYKSVAKEMESMLKVALEQLKTEQKLRKEANANVDKLRQELNEKENVITELDYKVKIMQHNIDLSDSELSKRQTMIENLKATVKNLLEKERRNACKENLTKVVGNYLNNDLSTTAVNQRKNKIKKTILSNQKSAIKRFEDDIDNNVVRESKVSNLESKVSKLKQRVKHHDDGKIVKKELSNEFVQDIVQHFKADNTKQKVNPTLESVDVSSVNSKEGKNKYMSNEESVDNYTEGDNDDYATRIKKEEDDTCTIDSHENEDFISETIMKTSERPCDLCDKVFPSGKLLKQHKDQHHCRFKCLYCPKTFKYEANQIEHEETSHGNKRYQCKRCPRKFRSKVNCKRHEVNNSYHEKRVTNSTPVFNCPVCGKQYDGQQRWGFEKHIKSHKIQGGYQLGDINKWRA